MKTMAQPIARWLELHAQLGAIDTRNYAAQLSARSCCDDLRFCVEDFLDCGLDVLTAKGRRPPPPGAAGAS